MMVMTQWNNPNDKEPTMSRIVKIATASLAIVALVALGSPAVASSDDAVGGAIGCCKVR